MPLDQSFDRDYAGQSYFVQYSKDATPNPKVNSFIVILQFDLILKRNNSPLQFQAYFGSIFGNMAVGRR